MSYNMVSIRMAEQAITNQLGDIDDIPKELANTVANIYYRLFSMGKGLGAEGIPSQMKRATDMRQGFSTYLEESAMIIATAEAIPESIQALRNIDKRKQPNLYGFSVAYILDEFKYNIKNAHRKPELWRKVERLFKKSKVNEIPNLIDLMDCSSKEDDACDSLVICSNCGAKNKIKYPLRTYGRYKCGACKSQLEV